MSIYIMYNMQIKLDILIYPTLYNELSDNIVIFCDKINNHAVEICYVSLYVSVMRISWV